jgi:hypothetical protein
MQPKHLGNFEFMDTKFRQLRTLGMACDLWQLKFKKTQQIN